MPGWRVLFSFLFKYIVTLTHSYARVYSGMICVSPFISFTIISNYLVNLTSAANLLVVQAGIANPKESILWNGFSICPTSFSNTGISVKCQS